MAAPAQQSEKGRCRLLELPGELRNHIYELALVNPARNIKELRLAHSAGTVVVSHDYSEFPLATALARTCKQIRQECGTLIYELNCVLIKLQDGDDGRQITKLLKPYLTQIRRLEIHHPEISSWSHLCSAWRGIQQEIRELHKKGIGITVSIAAHECGGSEFNNVGFRITTFDETGTELDDMVLRVGRQSDGVHFKAMVLRCLFPVQATRAGI